jgi:tetratricopeptide (TPR) repeat protein
MRYFFFLFLFPFFSHARPDTTQAHKDWSEAEKFYSLQEYSLAGPAYSRAQIAFLKAGMSDRAGECLVNAAISFRYERKAESIDEGIIEYQKALAKKWSDSQECIVRLAKVEYWFAKRNLDSAETEARKAIEIRRKQWGPLSWKTNQIRSSLGIILSYKDEPEKALKEFIAVLESAELNFQAPHERIQRALNNVGNAYSSLLDYRNLLL